MKKRILFLVPYPFDVAPSQRFRFENFLENLKNDYAVTYSPFWDEDSYKHLHHKHGLLYKAYLFILRFIKRMIILFHVHQFDLIYMHLELFPIYIPIIEPIFFYLFSYKIIYDIDDFVFLPHSKSRIVNLSRPYKRFERYFSLSKKVVVVTRFFSKYIPDAKTRMVVFPSVIDCSKYEYISKKDSGAIPVIGWSGSISTSAYLKCIEKPLIKIAQKFEIKIKIIGNKRFKFDGIPLESVDWNKESEVQELKEIDIGLYPLPDQEWVLGKCGLKAFQYMALGIPVIAQKTLVNQEIISDGINGFLAESEDEWEDRICILLIDRTLRKQMGLNGRNTILERFSTRIYSEIYLKIIRDSLL